MFNKKIKIIDREINGKRRFILDFLGTKESIYDNILKITSNFNNAFVLFDSNIAETDFEKVDEQINKITDFLKDNDINYDIIKYKVEDNKSVLRKMFSRGKGKRSYAYKIGFIINNKVFKEIIDFHFEYGSNMRLGLNFKNDSENLSIRDFISNMISDENRFQYYDVDLFYNKELKRVAIFSNDEEEVLEIVDNYKER